LSESFTALIGSNQVLYACWVILSSINERQLFHTIAEELFIVLTQCNLLVNFS
jgi:hypothetical protein